MKRLLLFATAITVGFLLFSSVSWAGDKDNSLLWKVTGKELKQPSYVFGTIHMICKDDYVLKPKVVRAINEAQELYLEIDMTDTAQMMGLMMMMVSTKPMSDGLTEKEKNKLDKFLQEKVGMPLSMMEYVKPSAVYILTATKLSNNQCDSVMSYEVEMVKIAQEKGLKMGGLETMAQQMGMLDSVFTVKDLLKDTDEDKSAESYLNELIKAYKAENLKQVGELINKSEMMDEKTASVLLTNRNKNWADKMPALMLHGTHFFAVGAGHLVGNNGLLQLLRNKGYTVTPVMD